MIDALSAGQKLERESLHRQELPIARNTQVYANSQRTKPPYASVLDFCFYPPEEGNRIASDVCDAYAELLDEQILPTWAIALAPNEELVKNKKGDPVPKPRLWMNRGIALLLPRAIDGSIFVGMLVCDWNLIKPGLTTVWDIDSSESHEILLTSTENSCETGIYLELAKGFGK